MAFNSRAVAGALCLLLIAGCARDKAQSASVTPEVVPVDPWVITNLDPNGETPALLWNGLVGVRLGSENKLFDIGHYQRDGEEKILPEAGFLDLVVSVSDEPLDRSRSGDYASKLDMTTGVVTESWSQAVQLGGKVRVTVETVVHPEKRAFGQRWLIDYPAATKVRVHSSLGGDSLELGPSGGTVDSSANPAVNRAGRRWFLKDQLTSTGSTGPVFTITRTAQTEAEKAMAFEEIVSASKDYWTKAWQTDIEIEGPVEDQQFVRSALFYLRGAIHPDGGMSVSPMGLSSDIYNGHVFWDADIWVFPALALIDPERAKAIPEYRIARSEQAYQNFFKWAYEDGRPTASGKVQSSFLSGRPYAGRKFPWESSVTGKETVPGPSRFQDHITSSIAFSINQASALGLVHSKQNQEIQIGAQIFSWLRSEKGKGDLWEIKATMSPDEHHTGDNDLYTNLLAMWATSLETVSDDEAKWGWYVRKRARWPAKPTYKLPQDDQTFLTYDNDALRGYKQAAAVLSIYPLQYPPAEEQARAMMERFADKVTQNGPAMTDSIHSIIWARLGEKEKAYQAWHESWKPFVKPPFLLFSEKRNSSRTYFTTGAAGSLQAVLFGFAGLRIDSKKAPNAQWSMPLQNGQILSIAPNLPKEWKKLTLRNLTVLGKKLTFEIEGDRVRVVEAG